MDMRRGALARCVKLLFERRNLCPEINKLNLQPLTLDLEPVDKVTFLAQLHKLACGFAFKLLLSCLHKSLKKYPVARSRDY